MKKGNIILFNEVLTIKKPQFLSFNALPFTDFGVKCQLIGNVCVTRDTLGHSGHSGRLVLAPQPRVWHR